MPASPGEAFNPRMSGIPEGNTPESGEWTRTAGPDESIVVTGANFTRFSGIDEGKDSRFKVFGPSGFVKDASIQRLENNKSVITLSKDLPSWAMYLVWPGNSAGFGKPFAVNKTDSWWVGPSKAPKGTVASVYGRNLAKNNDSTYSHVYIQGPAGGQWATITKVNPYKVDFIVPSNLANGDYEVWTHNGHGGDYGWSGPLKLTITDGMTWSQTIFNVKDFGATGNGTTDDTEAIKRALVKARYSYGSTILFPAGTYMISDMLMPDHNTKWLGAGSGKTFIKCNSNFNSGTAMIFGSVNNLEISDLTFDTNKNYRAVHSEAFFLRGSKNLRISNVVFSFPGYNVLQFDNSSEIFMTNCKLVGRISFLGKASELFIDRCHFYLTNDTENALHSWGGSNISMTNSTCQDYNNSDPTNGAGWGKGRFFCATGNFGSTRNTYLGNNSTYDLTVREGNDVDQNSGEQFLWEGFAASWSGKVTSSSLTSTALNGFSKALQPLKEVAVITKGRGLGQSRRILKSSGSTIILETPWNVLPDETSTIAVGNFADRIVMYKNFIDGKAYAVSSSEPSASSGIQPYGGTLNFIADRNTIQEVRSGIGNYSTQHQTGVDPNYFSLYTNNKIINCRWGIQNGLDMWQAAEIGILGTTYRRNTISTTLQSGILNTVTKVSTPVVENSVYEHNEFSNVRTAFSTGGDLGLANGSPSTGDAISTQTFYKNSFSSSSGLAGIKLTQKITLRDNTFSGFEAPYTGLLTEPVFKAPLHVVEITGTKGSTATTLFTIWNSGVTALNWQAKSSAAWLSLSDSTGTIPNERGTSNLTLHSNSSALPVGTHTAFIDVIASGKTQKYTVIYTITESAAPIIALSVPAENSSFQAPASATITASASDKDGSIVKVEFFHGSTKLGEDLTSPYSFNWSNIAAGNYIITAKATDNSGLSTVSEPVNITVTAPVLPISPVIALSVPSNSLTVPASTTLTATANDADGTVAKVEFFAGSTKLGEDLTSPYSFNWSNIAAGNYIITAKATDNSGLTSTSEATSISVNAAMIACEGTGSIRWEYWSNISGINVASIPVNTTPSGVKMLTSFASPVNFADNYGSRARGYICPPTSGEYTFYLASDDYSELWLSTSDNPAVKTKIAFVNDWTSPGEYTKLTSQQSVAIRLEAGRRYYIEALQKDGNGSDHLSVGWKLPDGTLQRPIAGNHLIPFEPAAAPLPVPPVVALTTPPNSLTAPASTTLTATANDADGTVAKVEFFAGSTKLGEDLTSPYSFNWSNIAAGNYIITAKATDNSGLTSTSEATSISVNAAMIACEGTGSIRWEYWSNISGINVASIPVNTTPSGVKMLTSFASPVNFADNYGSRARGYICPPTSGEYTFYLASDDYSELWLSTSDNPAVKTKIAFVNDWTSPGEYTKLTSQQSVAIRLEAGRRYYIEALQKDGNGSDHLSVGWKLPDGTLQRPIAGNHLIPFEPAAAPLPVPPVVALTTPPNSLTAPASTTLTATANDADGTVAKVEFFAGSTKLGEDLTSPYSFNWSNIAAGNYIITAKATDNSGLTSTSEATSISVNAAMIACEGTGSIRWEYWSNISGIGVAAVPVNIAPSGIKHLTSFASPVNFGENYASRARGYICTPASGNYTFYIASDDNAELWLSTDENPSNKSKIAYVNDWTNSGQYDKLASQQSVSIHLEAGRRYYIEAIQKEGNGSDHLSVGWKLPDGKLQRPIAGTHLVPFEPIAENLLFAPAVAITSPKTISNFNAPDVINFTATATDSDGEITKVEFFAGETKIGEDLASPYSISSGNLPEGTHEIRVKATDDSGITSVSQPVTISVSNSIAPVLSYNYISYPNPFQDIVSIEFTGVQQENATLQVFNLNGILIETLYKGKIESGQLYTFKFDGSKLPAGTYLARLSCGKNVFGKLMILSR